jgi:predicted lactoylglutathione lyase
MEAQMQPTEVKAIAPVLPVASVIAAAAYYRDRLGFSVRPVMPDSADYWVVVERGSVQIHLVPKGWPIGVSILVESVDQMASELKERGAKFESGPTSQEYGLRDFGISDLDGYFIGFWQMNPPREPEIKTVQMDVADGSTDDTPF